jgi:probable selenium-dependent hydroxylase accessory protein YqeC
MIPIEKIFCSEPQGVISFVGGGGKTSLMFHLAGLLALSGFRVLTTTTTRIFIPTPEQSDTVIVDGNPHSVLRLASCGLKNSGQITAAAMHMAERGKLKGFDPNDIKVFEESGLFDWILVEADGAAGRPLKAPAEHEPAVPSCSTVLVAMAGLDILGKPLSEDLVFRSALAGDLMGLAEGDTVTESALVRLFAHPLGPFKGAPTGSRRFIFLNKADNPNLIASGARVAGQIRQVGGTSAEALIVGQALDRIKLHAVQHLGLKK